VLGVVAVIASALIVGGGVGLWTTLNAPHAGSAVDMRGRTVTLDPGETPIPSASSHAVEDTGSRLIVPSVHLDVPLGGLDAVDGQITPPGFTSAYQVRNFGVSPADGASGTVFIVMHSLRNGGVGPGNYITDVARQRSKLAPGAVIEAAGQRYTVTGSELVSKDQLAESADVWSNTPGRLLLITCLENADGSPSTQNLVIDAVR
jgi:hypothetical protein